LLILLILSKKNKMVQIEIDGRKIAVPEGERVLYAALGAGIFVPHLCAGREMDYHPGSCRLCWVEVEGEAGPVLACSTRVRAGMVVRSRSEAVDRLVRTGFYLLLSRHRLDCAHCPADRRCALQQIGKERGLKLRPRRAPSPLTKIEHDAPVDDSHPRFGLDLNRCVLCGQCVHVCNRIVKCRVLDFHRRGLATVVSTFQGRPLAEQSDCTACLACVKVCPVGALYFKE
jgi:bidirectional [NiFe] hydrogenase diaphorase subunit